MEVTHALPLTHNSWASTGHLALPTLRLGSVTLPRAGETKSQGYLVDGATQQPH